MVRFDCSAADCAAIVKIVQRAVSMSLVKGHLDDFINAIRDVTATHCNGLPLRLNDLLDADAFNFAHDFLGIERHLNRETGQLENHFRPRFARRAARSAAS